MYTYIFICIYVLGIYMQEVQTLQLHVVIELLS